MVDNESTWVTFLWTLKVEERFSNPHNWIGHFASQVTMSLTYMNLEDVEDHFVDLMTIYNPLVTVN